MVELKKINNRIRSSENSVSNYNNDGNEENSDHLYYNCRDVADLETSASPVDIRQDGFYSRDNENENRRNRNPSESPFSSSFTTALRIITARDKSPDFLIFPVVLFIICYFLRISYTPFHLTIFVFYQYLSGNSFISFFSNFFVYYSVLITLKIVKYIILKQLKWIFNS